MNFVQFRALFLANFGESPECELRLYGVLRSSSNPHPRKFDKNSLQIHRLWLGCRCSTTNVAGLPLGCRPYVERRVSSSNRREIVGTCFGKGELVEKVDGAFGVAGSNDACGFSGLGLAAW